MLLSFLALAIAVPSMAFSAPYAASALRWAGLDGPAAKLYAFDVIELQQVSPALAPEWAFSDLAELRGDPPRLIEIAKHAKQDHAALKRRLYATAIERAGPEVRADWLEDYGAMIGRTDPKVAADAYAAAADIVRRETFDDEARFVGDLDASLALRDDPDVRWRKAQLYLQRGDRRAEDVLRQLIDAHQDARRASYVLGLLLWKNGQRTDAYTYLREAAKENAYRSGLVAFLNYVRAANDAATLDKQKRRALASARSAFDYAQVQHQDLDHRLREFKCDVRQFPGWETRSDLGYACAKAETDRWAVPIAVALFAWMIGPELLVARGLAGDIGALEGRAVAGEAAGEAAGAARTAGAAASRPAAEEFAARVTRELRTGAPDAVETSLEVRKSYAWRGKFDADLTVSLDAEQSAVSQEIELSFTIERERITRYYEPREQHALEEQRSSEAHRDTAVAEIVETTHKFRIPLGKVRPADTLAPGDCGAETSRDRCHDTEEHGRLQ